MIDPMTASLLLGGGGLLSAGGNIAGGFLAQSGGLSEGDMLLPTFNPRFDPALAAQQFDALGAIGFGDINRAVTPLQELINQIDQLPANQRKKRRAKLALQDIRDGVEDPRKLRNLEGILKDLGMDRVDLDQVLDRDAAFREQQQRLSDSGLGGLREQTILDRAQSQANAAAMLRAASDFGRTGEPQNAQQQAIFDRLQRNIDDAREGALLRAEHAGFNPALAEERFAEAELDKGLQGFLESLQQAGGIAQVLNASLGPAQQSAGISTGAANNALAIAAQQSQAANSLLNQNSMNDALSMANAVGAAGNTLGQSIMLPAILGGEGIFGSVAPAASPQPATSGFGGPSGLQPSSGPLSAGFNFRQGFGF